MKLFFGAFCGAFIAIAAFVLLLGTLLNEVAPMVLLTVAAAEKTLGEEEARELVRTALDREWRSIPEEVAAMRAVNHERGIPLR